MEDSEKVTMISSAVKINQFCSENVDTVEGKVIWETIAETTYSNTNYKVI